jgi:hypothetical protein
MTDSIHLARFIEHMLDGDNFDPNIKDFSAEARSALISAGDNIEDVLTSTLNVLAQSPTIQLRDFDPAATRALVERLRFWEALVTALEVIHRMARDQELVLEDSLQRTANHINKELKHYTDDNALTAGDFKDLITYMSRSSKGRRRNQRIIDQTTKAVEEASQTPPKPTP